MGTRIVDSGMKPERFASIESQVSKLINFKETDKMRSQTATCWSKNKEGTVGVDGAGPFEARRKRYELAV